MIDNDEEFDVHAAFAEALELNAAIARKTREMVLEVRTLARAHEALAEKYDEIGDALTAAARASADKLGDAIMAELGDLRFAEEGDEEDEDA